MTSAAERFARAEARGRHPESTRFAAAQGFDLDPFQIAGCHALEDGRSVLVAAPTGAGKTIVGGFAAHLAMLTERGKVFYTTPMKALSNQKFREFQETYGVEEVGLLTGDTNINADARVLVMTTEVLRNMLYADSAALRELMFVVMDEVHYLADRFRGAVWEEVIIHLPRSVRVVALSATVSNAEEFGDWLGTVRGETEVIVSESRPVPLEQHVLARGELVPLFDERPGSKSPRVNRELRHLASAPGGRAGQGRRGRSRGVPPVRRFPRTERSEVVRLLARDHLLPAIFFIFSRAGCDQAVAQLRRNGVRLTDADERRTIREIARERTRTLQDEDLAVLRYDTWLADLENGVAAHHAGLLPAFKEVVEELFRMKLVKVVFATETLALGINMPARTVVLEKLEKFNGEARVPVTSGEYTQITGRAGRRGIDVEGHAVVQWSEGMDPEAVASLASRRTYPLHSSFRPTYNMAVNLIDRFGRARAREVLESSFAQFQADRAVVGLARKVREQETSLDGYREALACDLGDFLEYWRLRQELAEAERGSAASTKGSSAKRARRRERIQRIRTTVQEHPCRSCPDRDAHARWADRYLRLEQEVTRSRRQIDSRTGTVARQFDHVLSVLRRLGYVAEEQGETTLTDVGRSLRRIYGERDLLIAEALRQGLWQGCDAPALAALASCLVYQPRRDDTEDGYLPRGPFRQALTATQELWAELDDIERESRLPGSEPLGTGIATMMERWARGDDLERVLRETDLAAGDFVRWAKQTIDVLDQIALVAPSAVARPARQALEGVRRGIVAYSSL